MIRNFFINLFFIIPVWIINIVYKLNKDIKREYIFDAQSKFLFALMPKFDLHLIEDNEIPKVRDLINERRKNIRMASATKKKVKTIDHLIDKDKSLLIREYIPYKTDNENVILYFHGGGYVLNSVDTHDPTVAYFSEKLRTKIYSLEYSLSPENKFPDALNEALYSIDWLIQNDIEINNSPIIPEYLGKLVKLIKDDVISGKIAKDVLLEMFDTKKDPEIIIEEEGLKQVTDTSQIEIIVDEVISENQKMVEQYLSGKDKLLGFFVGQSMKKSKGKANPKILNEILKNKLSKKNQS